MEKMIISHDRRKVIEWEPLGRAFESISKERQKEVIKWNSDFCGASENLMMWKEQKHQKCPVCGFDGEDTEHILRCPHPEANNAWSKALINLGKWFQQSISPDNGNISLENLPTWRDRPPVHHEGPLPKLNLAVCT